MTPYTEQLQQLYIAFFKRPADVGGLAAWEATAAAEGLQAVLPALTGSAEYRSLYEGLSNQQVVSILYQNLFGREGEPAGLAYWGATLDRGTLTLESLALAMIDNAAGEDATALAHKTAAAAAFTAALDSTAKADGYRGEAANDIARAWIAAITEEPSSARAAMAAMPSVLANVVDAGNGITHGKVVDGYIAGATIFADANGNGSWDEGEARTVTDARGEFTLTGAKGTLIATGGTDLGTKLAFNGVMIAPEGATVVNPITTLQQTLIQQGQSVEQAQATLAKAFGIGVANIDLDQRNPLEAVFVPGASAADLVLAVQMQAAAAKIQNLVVAVGEALTGAMSGLASTAASVAASKALAELVRTDADGVVSLSDKAILAEVLTDSAGLAGASAQQAAVIARIAPGFSAIMADSAKSVDAIGADAGTIPGLALARIVQVQTAVQGAVGDAIHRAATSGDIGQATQQFTGSQLSTVILGTKIGDVVPGMATDTSVIDIVNGTPRPAPDTQAPVPDTRAPAPPTGLALAAADDTGVVGDGLTRVSNGLTINGRAEAGSTVELYEQTGAGNLMLLGTATATGGSFSIDVNLANGAHQLVARATDASKNVGLVSTPLTVTVDTQGPNGLRINDLLSYDTTYVSSNYGNFAVAGHDLVRVGGTNGFGTYIGDLDTDDAFAAVDISALFTSGLAMGEATYSGANQFFVGVNGYVTLGVGNSGYSASGIAGYRESPMIAAQYDDIVGGRPIAQSPGGTSTGSNHIYYHVDTTTRIVTITWDDVAPYDEAEPDLPGNDYTHGNAFQIRLHQLQGSDFLIETRYESMSWVGGNTTLPTAGWTAGDGINYGEVVGSGTAAMLDLENTSNFGHNGVYLWEVKNGVVTDYVIDVYDVVGKTAFELVATDPTTNDVLTYSLGSTADERFSLVNGNQIKVAASAQFDLATESTVTLPVTVTDKAGNTLTQDMVITLFATADTTAPLLQSTTPATGATAIAAGANLQLNFSEAVKAGTGNIELWQDSGMGAVLVAMIDAADTSQVSFNGMTMIIDPSADFIVAQGSSAEIYVEMDAGVVVDLVGNQYAGINDATTFAFTVG
jgi:methionine-rich copper-binding protein CopC